MGCGFCVDKRERRCYGLYFHHNDKTYEKTHKKTHDYFIPLLLLLVVVVTHYTTSRVAKWRHRRWHHSCNSLLEGCWIENQLCLLFNLGIIAVLTNNLLAQTARAVAPGVGQSDQNYTQTQRSGSTNKPCKLESHV